MNWRFTAVETSLNRAEFRWKWLRFLQQSFALGISVSLACLFFGGAILLGWVSAQPVAVTFFVVLGALAVIAWTVILINILTRAPDRRWLASVLEHVDRRFMDRLNTLLFLETRREEVQTRSFAERIARQTKTVIEQKAPPPAFAANRSLGYMALFVVTLMLTLVFYNHYSPWGHLVAAHKIRARPPVKAEKAMELALPATNNVEQKLPWGEVRITDPGADLKVTKIDVVPLQIEAAANQPLKSVGWFSTINGAGETAHPLPPPSEPRYALYKPVIYLDELQLSDWDVMTYYAKARAGEQNKYASEVYFLEVRPFREDILKMPGGEGGKAYNSLNDISTLINRQEHIIRQTHQHIQSPPPQENLQAQDRKKLSEAEGELADSAQHLYAKMAAEMENKPIGEALDNLAKAQKSLGQASKLLADNVMNDARSREHSALAELVAARKTFQKAVSDNPGSFGDSNSSDEPTPVAKDSNKLTEMAEFRNEAKAAQEFVQKTLEQQKSLEQQANSAPRSDYPRLGAQQERLQQQLQQFRGQHPQVFKGTEEPAQQAQQAMGKAADALQRRGAEARSATAQATEQLEKFSQAMQNRAAQQQLADAYKLKQMLDQQAHTLDQRAQSNSKVPDSEAQQAANAARQTLNQLKKTAEEQPTRDAFGQPLRDALSDPNKAELDAKLDALTQPQSEGNTEANQQQKAGAARDALAGVSKAFEASQPKDLQRAGKQDTLKPGKENAFAQGMAELDSLVQQLENERQPSPQDQAKQGQQALENLQSGLNAQFGNNERGQQLLQGLKQALKSDAPLDAGTLRKLMEQLQRFALEAGTQLAKKDDQPEVNHIDPAKLPPAYRGRIQKYFQKLSEK